MDLDSGKLVKINNIGAIIEAYFYSVYDPSQRMLYALGIGGDSSFVDNWLVQYFYHKRNFNI
jgi:hypothetical protein